MVLARCPQAHSLTSLSLHLSICGVETLLCLHHQRGAGWGSLGLLRPGAGSWWRRRGQDWVPSSPGQKDNRPGDKFQLTFPLRTNYMYAKVKKSLPEMYAFTVCMWLKATAAPGVGTPFSYAVPGQANELVLIEWGNNPMEILINDKVEPPPLWARPPPHTVHAGFWGRSGWFEVPNLGHDSGPREEPARRGCGKCRARTEERGGHPCHHP